MRKFLLLSVILFSTNAAFAQRTDANSRTNSSFFGWSKDDVLEKPSRPQKPHTPYTWKMQTENLAVGVSAIGLGLGAYILSNQIISTKIEKITSEPNPDAERIENLGNTRKIINYVCGGVSIVGVIVVLTGLRKDYNGGIKVSDNTSFNATSEGVSLSMKF